MELTDKRFFSSPRLFQLCHKENERQLKKWGTQTRTPFEWLAFTTEELGELAEAITEHYFREGTTGEVVKEAIQVATLALKIAEMYMGIKDDE